MSRRAIERQLTDVHRRLQRKREELRVVEEQFGALADAADDARIRSMVSETPLAEVEHRGARRHVDAMARSRAAVLESISELERLQDALLDRLEVT